MHPATPEHSIPIKALGCAAIALALLLTAGHAAAGTEEGIAAFKQGDYQRAFEELKPAADDGDARAQAYLGEVYLGEGKPQNFEKARKWLSKAIDNGYAQAASSLGVIYANGLSVKRDPEHAYRLYQLAAQAGSPEGQANLGLAYKNGNGTGRDYDEAVFWLTRAANQEVAAAQEALARMYALGDGVDKDREMARRWARSAAQRGEPKAQSVYGHLLKQAGQVHAAYQWIRRAAIHGQPQAVREFGVTLVDESIVKGRSLLGVAWMALASKLDQRYDDKVFQGVLDQLTDEQERRVVQLTQKIAQNPEKYAPRIPDSGATESRAESAVPPEE